MITEILKLASKLADLALRLLPSKAEPTANPRDAQIGAASGEAGRIAGRQAPELVRALETLQRQTHTNPKSLERKKP